MGTVSTTPSEEARSIFTELGYTVSGSGSELRAERKWRVVHVTAADESTTLPNSGDLRCFVAWEESARELRKRLLDIKPDYDWAVIGVDGAGEYEVLHPSVGPTLVS
ncbi:MAG TPA: hypothetical protein VFJ06_02635 [Halococcus sp.]|nr:hypothetical protein [Halococcus sp.]